jgi:tol-pal system protein YbgF
MKPFAVAALMLGAVACATVPQDEPTAAAAPVAAPDPRIGEMQTSMTELLERIDVLNERIARLEEDRVPAAAPAAAAVPQPASAEATPVAAPAQPQSALVGAKLADDYRQAIILFGRGRHAEARRGFQAVFDSDPAGDLADNALFWIGETYFAAGDYTNATRFYNRVVNEFSEENKAPDALFKIALAQERTGDLSLARKTLQQVIDRYPYSSPASSAKAELQRIRF